jgi:deoxyhypusine synthase
MAKKINNEESIYYWCYKNGIKVYCPGITDGSVGDVLFFQSYKFEHLQLDIMADHFELNEIVRKASHASAFIIGGGFIKHWVLQAGQNRNGYDSVVLINDGLQYDHSDSGKGIE